MMVSIRDVANLANVSPATVSRVINGTAKVAPETRERVLQAIAQTDFVPNEAARTLFKKSAKLIGLVIPSIRNPYFTQLADAIDEIVGTYGYRLFLCNVGYDPEKERAALQMLSALQADGVILASSNEDIQESIDACPIPVVALDYYSAKDRVDAHVYCDYYQGGRMAAEHLLECGCKNIVCIRGPQHIFSARDRYAGYRDVCREHGIPEQTLECAYEFDAGLAVTESLLEQYPRADGIISCNDIVAIAIYKALQRRQISVPDQIQLIGFDDIYLSNLVTPALTTVAQPIRAMAEKAIECIINRSEHSEAGEKIIFPATLVVRETTKRKGSGI